MSDSLEVSILRTNPTSGMPCCTGPGRGIVDILVPGQVFRDQDHGEAIQQKLSGGRTSNDASTKNDDGPLGERDAGDMMIKIIFPHCVLKQINTEKSEVTWQIRIKQNLYLKGSIDNSNGSTRDIKPTEKELVLQTAQPAMVKILFLSAPLPGRPFCRLGKTA